MSESIFNDLIPLFFYTGFGIVTFLIAFAIMVKLSPFSVVKEIEEDQNTSLSILFGSIFIGLAIIIGAGVA